MAGDFNNTNKIVISFESTIFLTSLFFVVLYMVGKIYVSWVTPISWLIFLGTVGFFIIKLIQNINN